MCKWLQLFTLQSTGKVKNEYILRVGCRQQSALITAISKATKLVVWHRNNGKVEKPNLYESRTMTKAYKSSQPRQRLQLPLTDGYETHTKWFVHRLTEDTQAYWLTDGWPSRHAAKHVPRPWRHGSRQTLGRATPFIITSSLSAGLGWLHTIMIITAMATIVIQVGNLIWW